MEASRIACCTWGRQETSPSGSTIITKRNHAAGVERTASARWCKRTNGRDWQLSATSLPPTTRPATDDGTSWSESHPGPLRKLDNGFKTTRRSGGIADRLSVPQPGGNRGERRLPPRPDEGRGRGQRVARRRFPARGCAAQVPEPSP